MQNKIALKSLYITINITAKKDSASETSTVFLDIRKISVLDKY